MPRVLVMLLLLGVVLSSGCADGLQAEPVSRVPTHEERFDDIVARYTDLSFQQLADDAPRRQYVDHLSFDPSSVKFYDEAVKRLQLTDVEREMLHTHGFVSVDHAQRYSIGSLYFAVYSNDLPVLVTTDSILHAMHRTYDDMLMEMEHFFTVALDDALARCHDELPAAAPRFGALAKNYQDVDLYLTVARNLLQGAGAPAAPAGRRMHPGADAWDGSLMIESKLSQDELALEILKQVQSLAMQSSLRNDATEIYGGKRPIDFSQFQPRGHYTKSVVLSRYFRAMMWLGRADTGWNLAPPDPASGIVGDAPRELRNAALLTQLLTSTGGIERLRQISDILDFMVGEGDNLTVFQMRDQLREQGIDEVGDLASSSQVAKFQQALLDGELGAQRIRSQAVVSNPQDLHQVPPPSVFQLFGQRFVLDSFVLSKVIFDSIIFDGKKVERMMPTGLDVMVALGNDTALPLLKDEMAKFPYAANLKASQRFIDQHEPKFWRENLYNIWLDALRTLDADLTTERHLPQALRTSAWQRKQLQTQLASWSELRHNTVLYAKQSYSAEAKCEYPAGYVEPYPETYARIKFFAEEAARRIDAADYSVAGARAAEIQDRQVAFLKQMATTVGRLEALARKELAAEPFSPQDEDWLKAVIDIRRRGSGGPQYTGWYCQLFYKGGRRCAEWDPTIIDVHTEPNSQSVLEAGVGNCNFLVVAVDNERDRMIYVGPAYSYYEFHHPAASRLTDADWMQMLANEHEPPRPAWTKDFQAPRLKREAGEVIGAR